MNPMKIILVSVVFIVGCGGRNELTNLQSNGELFDEVAPLNQFPISDLYELTTPDLRIEIRQTGVFSDIPHGVRHIPSLGDLISTVREGDIYVTFSQISSPDTSPITILTQGMGHTGIFVRNKGEADRTSREANPLNQLCHIDAPKALSSCGLNDQNVHIFRPNHRFARHYRRALFRMKQWNESRSPEQNLSVFARSEVATEPLDKFHRRFLDGNFPPMYCSEMVASYLTLAAGRGIPELSEPISSVYHSAKRLALNIGADFGHDKVLSDLNLYLDDAEALNPSQQDFYNIITTFIGQSYFSDGERGVVVRAGFDVVHGPIHAPNALVRYATTSSEGKVLDYVGTYLNRKP